MIAVAVVHAESVQRRMLQISLQTFADKRVAGFDGTIYSRPGIGFCFWVRGSALMSAAFPMSRNGHSGGEEEEI